MANGHAREEGEPHPVAAMAIEVPRFKGKQLNQVRCSAKSGLDPAAYAVSPESPTRRFQGFFPSWWHVGCCAACACHAHSSPFDEACVRSTEVHALSRRHQGLSASTTRRSLPTPTCPGRHSYNIAVLVSSLGRVLFLLSHCV